MEHRTAIGPLANSDGYVVVCDCGWYSHASDGAIAYRLANTHTEEGTCRECARARSTQWRNRQKGQK
jgi:hypothetical protein